MAALENLQSAPAAWASPSLQEKQPDLDRDSDLDQQQPASESSTGDNEMKFSPYPAHPIAQLQGPFEESILETKDPSASDWVVDIDAQSRRRDLLENDDYERLCGRKWRQRTTERYHPFWKLVSQMVFGVHLLAKRLAKSETQVMQILQGHVDEMDGFLQRTTEDFLIIHLDVRTRIQYLSLPLGNLEVFDQMLEDRNFRLSLVTYNDLIEHAIERFTLAITDAVKDLRKCRDAMSAFWHYLHNLDRECCFETDSLSAFYQTMMENTEGWLTVISKLRRRGAALHKALGQLSFAVTEMQRRVGVASRKDVAVVISSQGSPRRSVGRKLFSRTSPTSYVCARSEKPLPRDPLSAKSSGSDPRKIDPSLSIKASADFSDVTGGRRNSAMPKFASQAKPCDSPAIGAHADAPTPSPQTLGILGKTFVRPFLHKRAASAKNVTQDRPTSAPASTVRPRSVSIDQLKGFWTSSRPQTQQSVTKTPKQREQPRPQKPGLQHMNALQQAPQQPTDSFENMRNHISHFLKADRVVEAWDNAANKTGRRRQGARTRKGWPCSIFRARNTGKSRLRPGKSSDLTGASAGVKLEKQMSWVQDAPECQNTYFLKPRDEASPRIHVMSVPMKTDKGMRIPRKGEARVPGASNESSSTVTALPAVQPPTPTTVHSIISLHRPQKIECSPG